MKQKALVHFVQMDTRFDERSALGCTCASGKAARASGRPFTMRVAGPFCRLFDRLIGGSSLVSTEPVLDMRQFPWTATLRENWQAIRDEARLVTKRHGEEAARQSFFLYDHGRVVAEHRALCPRTAEIVARLPGLDSAYYSILPPGTHIPAHRGVTKGLITCHLGLIVPRDGDVRMRVHDRVVRWAEGETLVFDDTYPHEIWSETSGMRILLSIRFRRPLAQPGKWLADLFMGCAGRVAQVRETRAAGKGDVHG